MTAQTNVPTWAERPRDPKCKRRVPMDEHDIAAMKTVLEGEIGPTGPNPDALLSPLATCDIPINDQPKLTGKQIAQVFVQNQKRLVSIRGGVANTSDCTIVSVGGTDDSYRPDEKAAGILNYLRKVKVAQGGQIIADRTKQDFTRTTKRKLSMLATYGYITEHDGKYSLTTKGEAFADSLKTP